MAKLTSIQKLLASEDLITKERMAKALNISLGTARNTLARWETDGIVEKISTGCYLSTVSPKSKSKAVETAVRLHPAVKDAVLVGASCWQKAGWCDTEFVHAVIPLPPCRALPHVVGARLHRAGQRDFNFMKLKTTLPPGEKIARLNPVAMMLWYMDKDCPIMMPSPENIHWEIVEADHDLRYVMRNYWPEMARVENFSVRALYEMIYMDRWDGTTPGVTEHRAPQGTRRVPFNYPERPHVRSQQQQPSEISEPEDEQAPSF